jgi:sugar lactone lactonase YvrE
MNCIESLRPEFSQLVAPDAQVEAVAKGFVFTEGPLWDSRKRRLLFSDMPADTIYSWSKENGTEVFRHPAGYPNGLTFNRRGDLVTCEHRTRGISVTENNSKPKVVASTYQGKKLNSPNDIIAANDGSILFTDPIYGLWEGQGGPAEQELSFQGVYRLTPDYSHLELITDSFERPNGLALSPDEKQLYVIDTVRQHIRVFDIGVNWKLSGGHIWVELWDDDKIGRPDGMKFDKQGNLFSTGPGGVWVFNPSGDLLGRIYLPEKTSNLGWGDADMRSLYITCSSAVYRVRCLTSGIPIVTQ